VAHLSKSYRRRAAISVVTTATASTSDIEFIPPDGWAEFWDAVDTDGYGVRVTMPDGVTPIVYAWSGFSKTGRAGTLQIESAPTPSDAGRCVLFWVYYDIDAPTDGAGSVTMTAPLTASLDLAAPDPAATYRVEPQAPGEAAPLHSFGKAAGDQTFVWLDFSTAIQRVGVPYNGRLQWEEMAVGQVAVLDDTGASVASMTDAADQRWVSVRDGARDRIYLKVRVKGGADLTNYTLVSSFFTATPDASPYRTISYRVGITVRDLLTGGAVSTAPLGTSGWASYVDTTHTSGSPQAYSSGTRTQWTNDGGTTIDTYAPNGALWSSDKITPTAVGEAYELRIDFTIDPGGPSAVLSLELDIGADPFGGSSVVIVSRSFSLAKGAVVQSVSAGFPIYCLATFVANGGALALTSSVSADIYDKRITIVRVH